MSTPGIATGSRLLPVTVMAPLVVITGAVTAYLTTASLRVAATMVLVLVVVSLYLYSRRAGVIAMWLVWLLAPGIRRLFELTEGPVNADPLALLPFLTTGILGVLAIRSEVFSRRARRIMLVAAAGFALGIPTGLLHAANATAFAFVAYAGAITAFALGYQERPRKLGDLTLYRVLLFATPALAVYGIVQYFLPLSSWDSLWLRTVGFVTAGAPQSGHIRVWGSLNSPGTFAGVLGLALICYLVGRRVTLTWIVAILLAFFCLSLTYVRSAWFSLVVAALAFVLASRGAGLRRVLPVAAVIVVAFSALAGSAGWANAVVGRVNTFGNLGSDTSANARTNTFTALLPIASGNPLGLGLGQAGESARLGASVLLRNSDNGYLALMYQVGPLGFLLVIGAALTAFLSSARTAFRHRAPRGDLLVFGLLTLLFVNLVANDALFGILGVAFWYLLGVAVSSQEDLVDDRAALGVRPDEPPIASHQPQPEPA